MSKDSEFLLLEFLVVLLTMVAIVALIATG